MSESQALKISLLERDLAAIMRPIEPSPGFRGHLQQRLATPPVVTIEEQTAGKAFLILSLGLFSGILVVWFSRLLRGK